MPASSAWKPLPDSHRGRSHGITCVEFEAKPSPGEAPTIALGLPTRHQGFFSRTVVSERNNWPSRLSVNSTAWF